MRFETFENGYGGQMVFKQADEFIGPVQVEKDPTVYSDISDLLSREVAYMTGDPTLRGALTECISESEIQNLMEGTTNLINAVIERSRSGKPVETMIFLDKSARNGAYLFNMLWDTLEQTGELPAIEKPDIRFMNIGRFDDAKHNAKASLALLRAKFKNTNFKEDGVLVVDEYVSSGGSVRRALKTIEDEFEVRADAVAQFMELPKWYYGKDLGIKGITDNEGNNKYLLVSSYLSRLPNEIVLDLNDVVTRHRDNFQMLYSTIYQLTHSSTTTLKDWNVESFNRLNINNVTEKDMETVCELFLQIDDLDMDDGDAVEEFIKSAGGFLGRPLEVEEQKENNVIYRNLLKSVVKAYVIRKNMIPVQTPDESKVTEIV